jgi:predicted metal-dependent phosphoesterase TrpH
LKVDFHCHSEFSADSFNRIPALISAARKAGLDRLVITDHNSIRGALIAKQLAPELIIVGEEIKTSAGELLAFFVSKPIPKNLDPFYVIELLREQGSFISVSHPFDPHRSGWTPAQLEQLVPLVDAIEIMNARALKPGYNFHALEFARSHHLAGTAGSDAHLLMEVGRAALELEEFSDAESLRKSIRAAEPVGGLSPTWVHLGSTLAKLKRVPADPEIGLK